jgi:lysophospholipase L1-like esterase
MSIGKPALRALLLILSAAAVQSCAGTAHYDASPEQDPIPNSINFTDPQTFNFTESAPPDSYHVTPTMEYDPVRGYGFDLDTHPSSDNSPFYFSVKVPQGNYRVTIEFGHPTLSSSNTVKAESRRLYIEEAATNPREFIRRDFIVNIRNGSLTPPPQHAPGGKNVSLKKYEKRRLHWDEKLTLEINGIKPQVRSVTLQEANVPTVYLVGDSTVTDQPYEPAASWGQMLPVFFNDTIAIANHAESGETMKSFISGLRLAKVLERMTKGDYLMIQFGHNDQKGQWPQTYSAAKTTYKAYLRVFIAEARLRGATPILVTSMQRRTFDDNGKIVNSHGGYPQAVREVAQEMKVALVDLDARSVELYEALGVDDAPKAFNSNGKDSTHHNNYGAYQLAKSVIEEVRGSQSPLAAHLKSGLPGYDPSQPDPLNSFTLQPSPNTSTKRPEGS